MMLEGIPLNIGEVGGWGIATTLMILIVLGFYRGYLYPRATVEMLLKEAQSRLESEKERGDTWESAWNKCQLGHTVEAAADRTMLVETVALNRKILEAIQLGAQGGGERT